MINNNDMDIVRRCMLHSDIVLDMDHVALASPVKRCMIIAAALSKAAQKSSYVRELLSENSFMNILREETLARKTGVCIGLPSGSSIDLDRTRENYA